MSNLYTTLTTHGMRRPDALFATGPGGIRLTYAGLDARSAQFAHALRGAGVGPGDRIVVQVDKSLSMLMLYLASLRAGAVFVPLNPAYTTREVEHFLTDAEPALLVCDPLNEAAMKAAASAAGGIAVATLGPDDRGSLAALADGEAVDFATVDREDDDLAAILYTSGTTGRSKGAMLSHGNLASNALTLRDAWRFSEDDVLLHALPIFHTHGLFVGTNVTLAAGASMIFLQKFDVAAVMDALPKASVMMGVPTFYIRLLGEPRLDARLVSGVRLFVSGSAPLSADVHREFRERTGQVILERYGMTETNMNTTNPYDGERVPGSVGLPLHGVSVRITDQDSGAELPAGSVGNIEIAGPNVFQGYWRLPEKTAAEFHGDYFVSGDLGMKDERGYIHIVGRAKDLIIAGGYNIYPAEVEAALDELPGIRESAVIGVPHPDLGEGVVALVVPAGNDRIDEGVVSASLAATLARYKRPRRIIVVDELPKNAMGKVQKNVLRDSHANLFRRPQPA